MNDLSVMLAVLWPLATLLVVLGVRSSRAYLVTHRRLQSIAGTAPRSPMNLRAARKQNWGQTQIAAAFKLRRSEYTVFVMLGFILPALIGLVVRGVIGALILGVVGGGSVLLYARFMKARFLRQAEASLPDFLRGVASALRAGTSLVQAMALVAIETPDPLGAEVTRVLRRESFGFSLEQTLEEMTNRIPSKDLALAVMVINIQREVGGSLADILENIVATIVDRQRLAKEVRALTAQGRFSGWILTALPFFMGLAIWFLNPAYIGPLFHTRIGYAMLGAAALSVSIGGFVINKVVRSPEM